MKSASLELFKYLMAEGLQPATNPYIGFNDVPAGSPAKYEATVAFVPLFCPMLFSRVSQNDRWTVQWFQLSIVDHKAPELRAKEVIDLLEQIVLENSRAVLYGV